jgi:hypothetical protein
MQSSFKLLGRVASAKNSMEPILNEGSMRITKSIQSSKSSSKDDRKPIKNFGKTPDPQKAINKGSFVSLNITKGILHGVGATKGLSARDIYQVGAYSLNQTSKTPCGIIGRPPTTPVSASKNLSQLNL